jgi:hypothetical protein
MLVWIIQISLISFILIFLVHHLYSFFVSTLTIPKIRDLVNSPIEKYQHIFDTIGTNNSFISSSTNIDLLPTDSDINDYITPNIDINMNKNISSSGNSYLDVKGNTMKNELKNFLKKQLHSGINNNYDDSASVMGFSDTMSISNYSTL